jgi:two-component system phosphate regulon response regulator PhoB
VKQILVVEDEPGIQELLQLNLSMAGYRVSVANNADEAVALIRDALPDLVLIDWNMPGRSGVSLVRQLRQDSQTRHIPVIMLTARDDELDKVTAFDSGVDDYVTKPFRARELIARVQALLRRAYRDATPDVLEVDGLRELVLGPTEYRLLHFLVQHPMRVHTRSQLLNHVWGNYAELQERTVDAYVGRLRQLMDAAGHHTCIETVRSVGYRFLKREPVPEPRARVRHESLAAWTI